MGCGASVHAQGPEQKSAKETSKSGTPAPLAEDLQASRDPQVKQVDQQGAAEPVEGAPSLPAPIAEPAVQQLQDATSVAADPDLSSCRQEDDVLNLAASCSIDPDAATGMAWQEDEPAPRLPPASPPSQPQPLPQQPYAAEASSSGSGSNGSSGSSNTNFVPEAEARLVLGESTASSAAAAADASASADLRDPSRPRPLCAPGSSYSVFDPAVTPSSETATVTLLPDAPGGGVVPRARYTDESDLSIASHSYDLDGGGYDDSDDDELAALFTLQAWKRFYNYNKRKAQDLLNYFWKRFPPTEFSCFCISYRNQELLVEPFMAENCIHGYCNRLQDLGLENDVFLQMYVLRDPDRQGAGQHIVGLLLLAGQSLPPPLAALSAYDGFVYQRADTSRTLVKQFVSALLMGMSPMNSLKLISGREVL